MTSVDGELLAEGPDLAADLAEIARALDTSVSAVKSLVHRALEALRLVLAPEGAHP